MSFKNFYQFSNRNLIRNILFPIIRGNQFKSFLILILRFLTLGLFFSFRESQESLKYSIKGKRKFILDLRDAKLNLHLLGILLQFFSDIKEKFKNFEVWINENSFSQNPNRPYSNEFNDILRTVSKILKFRIISNQFKNIENFDNSYLKISYTNGYKFQGLDFNHPDSLKNLFIKKLKFKSKPINFSKLNFPKNSGKFTLSKILKNNFTLVMFSTFDENLKFEKFERRLGVISKKNFLFMKSIFESIQKKIKKENIKNFKIVFVNKKALNWNIDENIIDLRNFENYNLSFSELLTILNFNCNWTFGSEGTLSYYLLLCKKLKHVIFIDNSHWKHTSCNGSAAPFFCKELNYINYKNSPNQYIPISKKQVINNIFQDYKKFNKKKNG